MLQGYKTYIVAACVVIVAGLHALGKIDDTTYNTLLVLLGASGTVTMAAKINRVEDKVR